MVVVGIVVAIGFAVVPAIGGVLGVRTREEVGKIAGTIRAMYGEAAIGGSTCRLVFDLDEGSWWPECGPGRVRVAAKEESLRGARVEERERDYPGTDEEKAAREQVQAKNSFSSYSSTIAKTRRLPDGTSFDGVWTQHQSEVYAKGKAYLYFFPHGQTERAYIYVGSGNDVYTIIVNPMTGRAKIEAAQVPVPDRELRG